MLGSIYVLVSIGLTLTWKLLNFPNMAHAEFLTFGAYIGYVITSVPMLGFSLGLIVGGLATGILGVLTYIGVFSPLIRSKATSVYLTVASVGFGLSLRYAMQQIWGGDIHIYQVSFPTIQIGTGQITYLWLIIVLFALSLILFFHLLLTRSKIGKAMRAVANNPTLAVSSGINIKKILIVVWFSGSFLAGLGGVLRAADTQVYPYVGWELLLPAFAIVTLGGIGSFYGDIIASYILGLSESFSLVLLASLNMSTDYRTLVAFVVVIVVLIILPGGLPTLRLSHWEFPKLSNSEDPKGKESSNG